MSRMSGPNVNYIIRGASLPGLAMSPRVAQGLPPAQTSALTLQQDVEFIIAERARARGLQPDPCTVNCAHKAGGADDGAAGAAGGGSICHSPVVCSQSHEAITGHDWIMTISGQLNSQPVGVCDDGNKAGARTQTSPTPPSKFWHILDTAPNSQAQNAKSVLNLGQKETTGLYPGLSNSRLKQNVDDGAAGAAGGGDIRRVQLAEDKRARLEADAYPLPLDASEYSRRSWQNKSRSEKIKSVVAGKVAKVSHEDVCKRLQQPPLVPSNPSYLLSSLPPSLPPSLTPPLPPSLPSSFPSSLLNATAALASARSERDKAVSEGDREADPSG